MLNNSNAQNIMYTIVSKIFIKPCSYIQSYVLYNSYFRYKCAKCMISTRASCSLSPKRSEGDKNTRVMIPSSHTCIELYFF